MSVRKLLRATAVGLLVTLARVASAYTTTSQYAVTDFTNVGPIGLAFDFVEPSYRGVARTLERCLRTCRRGGAEPSWAAPGTSGRPRHVAGETGLAAAGARS